MKLTKRISLILMTIVFCALSAYAGGEKTECYINVKLGEQAFRIPNNNAGAYLSKDGDAIPTSGICDPVDYPHRQVSKFSFMPRDLPGFEGQPGYPGNFFAVQITGRLHNEASSEVMDYSQYPIEGEFYKPKKYTYIFVDETMIQPNGERARYGCYGTDERKLSCGTSYQIDKKVTISARQINTFHVPIADFKKFYLVLANYIEGMRISLPLEDDKKEKANDI